MFHTIWYLYDLMTTTLGKINGTVCVQSSTVYRPTQNVNKQFRTHVHCGAAMTLRLLQLDCCLALMISPATLNKR